jgi:hypothetical protein
MTLTDGVLHLERSLTYRVIKRFQPPSLFPSPVLRASMDRSSIFMNAGARTSTTCSLLCGVGGNGRLEAFGSGCTICRYGKFGTNFGSSDSSVMLALAKME